MREIARRFYPGVSHREVAHLLRRTWLLYQQGPWRRTSSELKPPHGAGTLDAALWTLCWIRDYVPSEMVIRRARSLFVIHWTCSARPSFEMEANTMAAGFEPATATDLEQSGVFYTGAGVDLSELLPPRAAEKLRMLRQQAKDLHALRPDLLDRQEANTARGDKERWLQRLLAPRSENGFNLPESDPEVVLARQELEKLADEARRLEERNQRRTEQWRSASLVVQAVEDWLKNGRPGGVVLEEFDGPSRRRCGRARACSMPSNACADASRELRADAHQDREPRRFRARHAKRRTREQVAALAGRGAVSVSRLIEHDGEIEMPSQQLRVTGPATHRPAVGFSEVSDIAIVAWLHQEVLIARLDAEIDAESDDKQALSVEARQQQEAEVLARACSLSRARGKRR